MGVTQSYKPPFATFKIFFNERKCRKSREKCKTLSSVPFNQFLSPKGFLHNSTLAASKYTVAQYGKALWEPKVHTLEVTKSLDHCASLCRIGVFNGQVCDMFSYINTTCYLGYSLKTVATITLPGGISDVYTDDSRIVGKFGKQSYSWLSKQYLRIMFRSQ